MVERTGDKRVDGELRCENAEKPEQQHLAYAPESRMRRNHEAVAGDERCHLADGDAGELLLHYREGCAALLVVECAPELQGTF